MIDTLTEHPKPPEEKTPSHAEQAFAGLVSEVADLQLAHLAPDVAAIRQQLQSRGVLTVAVFGSFKAGKSSFLNHLAACEALPVGVVPVTAIVTQLRFGERERAEVSFLDGGAKQEISLSEVRGYVSESENPENAKRVATVKIEIPSLRGLDPLQFVDTPGLGSALVHNTEATLRWLPNVGVALLAVSSESPLSDRDLAVLAELSRHTPKTALLLTKADLLTPSEQEEVLAFVNRQLKKAGRANLPAYFYSTRPGTNFRGELEHELLCPLLRDRGEAAGQILRHKLLSLADRALDHATVALAAATQASANRQSLRERLAKERREFGLLQTELRVRTQDWSAEFFEWTLKKLEPTKEALRARMIGDLRTQFPRWHMHLPKFLQTWRKWMQEFLARGLSEISRTEAGMFQTPLRNVRAHLERTLEGFHGRLAEHVQAALGATLKPRKFELEDREPAVPPVDVSFAFEAAFDMIAFLLPLSLFRPLIERALLRKAQDQLEKNLSRLASTWRDRVADEIAILVQSAEHQALDELKDLEQAAEQTRSGEAQLRRTVTKIEAWRDTFMKSWPTT